MKYLLILFYILPCFSVKAQTAKFISYSTQVTVRNEKGDPIHTENRRSKGIPVILDYKNNMLYTNGESPISIQLDTVIKHYKEANGNNIKVFIGRDQANQKCAVVYTIYEDNSSFDASIDISYQKMDLVFGLKYIK